MKTNLLGFSSRQVLAALLVLMLTVITTISATVPEEEYCVKNGYLYRSIPTANGNMEICQFPDNSYCLARDYFTGNCSYGSGFASRRGPTGNKCQYMGGVIRSVHTPFGDTLVCVLPDGTVCEMNQLSLGRCGDAWLQMAYDWLYAP